MKKLFKLWFLLHALSVFNLYANPTKQLETAFATSLVLTDGDSITLGMGDFDPQALFDPQHSSKDEDSIALRKNSDSTVFLILGSLMSQFINTN